MDIKEFFIEYWEELVALIDKIYAKIKEFIESQDDAE